MNERVKEVRKSLGLTQEQFGKKINMGRSNLSLIESGKVNVSPRVINDICEKFQVNEYWLRFGKGEMFKVIDDNEQFNKTLADLLVNCDEITKKTVISLSKLTREEFEFVSKILENLTNKNKKEGN
ncbi:helix-turn-helix domain-containing protein [Clostridium perfringens]